MSDEKERLKSDEVPGRFTEWLLAMGCPIEKVSSLDSAKQMCRGQYYIVWRSLMEQIEPKDTIRQKRVTVFSDDICKIKDNSAYSNKHKKDLIQPDELTLWHEQQDLKERVLDAESRITQAKEDLDHLLDKVSSKLSSRNTSRGHIHDIERQLLLLQKVTEHLEAKKSDLQETINIAKSLSYIERTAIIENKLEECVIGLRRQSRTPTSHLMTSTGNPVSCSSMISTDSEIDYAHLMLSEDVTQDDEHTKFCTGTYPQLWLPENTYRYFCNRFSFSENNIASLVKCRGDALWAQLYEKRAGLCIALSQACAQSPFTNRDKITSKSALAQMAALHCSIALEALKNKAHIRQTQRMLAMAITELNDHLSGDACEYLVLDCERTSTQSQVNTLRRLLGEIESREGFFECDSRCTGDRKGARQQISAIDKTILSKKEEMKKLLRSLAATEKKIFNIKQCLETVFSCLNSGVSLHNMERFKNLISLPKESIATIQQFYNEARKVQKKVDISFDLDLSATNSFIDCAENANPTFTDELRMYLHRFNLERNKKLVFENGEKKWICETLRSSLYRIYSKWQDDELPCSLLCPSVSLSRNLQTLDDLIRWKAESEAIVQSYDCSPEKNYTDIDIAWKTKEENEIVDKIKKRLNENLMSLQKVNRTLDLGVENMEFWNLNTMKQHISSNRTIDGKTYKDYEHLYLFSLKL